MSKIAIIGIYPPPLGGISVHIKRLKEILDNSSIETVVYNEGSYTNVENNILELKSYKSFMISLSKLDYDIVHFHCTTADVRSLLWLCKKLNKNKKIILTIHGISLKDQIEKSNKLIKNSIIKSLKSIDSIIVVNEEYLEYLPKYGINKNRIKYIQPFIKPILRNDDKEKIDKNVLDFLNCDGIKLLTNGSIKFYQSQELYGFDLLIESVNRLIMNGMDVKLLISILAVDNQNEREKEYYKTLKERVKTLGLQNKIMFHEVNNTEYYPILELGDIFIRATNTDGDPISLREALSLGIPSIASDVTNRPEKTIIFKNRNQDDLIDKLEYSINNITKLKTDIKESYFEDSTEKLLDFYKSLC